MIGTTNIGADDGIGIAIILAIAKTRDAFKHGPIRCLFTTDEEQGLIGASHIPDEWFKYNGEQIQYLINLDSEVLNKPTVATIGNDSFYEYCSFTDSNYIDLSDKEKYSNLY